MFNLQYYPHMIDVVLKRLPPGVTASVDEVETTTGILKANTRATTICIVLGIVGIVAGKDNLPTFFLLQPYIYLRRPAAADAMLEGILDERDKE